MKQLLTHRQRPRLLGHGRLVARADDAHQLHGVAVAGVVEDGSSRPSVLVSEPINDEESEGSIACTAC